MSRMTERLRAAGFVIHGRPAGADPTWRDTRSVGGKKVYPQAEAYKLALDRLAKEGRTK